MELNELQQNVNAKSNTKVTTLGMTIYTATMSFHQQRVAMHRWALAGHIQIPAQAIRLKAGRGLTMIGNQSAIR